MTETVLFDFDGVLVQSISVWHDGLQDMVQAMGIETDFEPLMAKFMTMRGSEIYQYLHDTFQTKESTEWMQAWMDRYLVQKYTEEIPETKGARDYLARLKAEGQKTAIVTASPGYLVMPACERLGFAPYVDAVISCEETGLSKRDSSFYAYVLKELGARPESTLLFEDSQVSIDSARANGIQCIGVLSSYPLEEGLEVIEDFTVLST